MKYLFCLLVLSVLVASVASIAVTVTSVVVTGNQTDTHLAPTYPNRDGGAVGTVGGKILWFWSDTIYNKNGILVGFYGNTGALGTAGDPIHMNGPERQAIPFTATESSFNTANSNIRVVLWPKSGVVEVSTGNGIIWVPKGYWGTAGTVATPNKGIVLATVTIGKDGYANVTRLSDTPMFPLTTNPSYGSIAATKDSNYVYLYSEDTIAEYITTTFIARVPLAQATNKAEYQYYNNHTGEWETTIPNVNETTKAIFITCCGIDGNVYYSTYHQRWILIYNYHGDDKVYMRNAAAPQGPWIQDTVIYTSPPPKTINYIYATTGTNLYDSTGKTASIDFTWCYSGGYANWVATAHFA